MVVYIIILFLTLVYNNAPVTTCSHFGERLLPVSVCDVSPNSLATPMLHRGGPLTLRFHTTPVLNNRAIPPSVLYR